MSEYRGTGALTLHERAHTHTDVWLAQHCHQHQPWQAFSATGSFSSPLSRASNTPVLPIPQILLESVVDTDRSMKARFRRFRLFSGGSSHRQKF